MAKITNDQLQPVLRVTAIDAHGTPLAGTKVEFYDHQTGLLLSTAQTASEPATFQSSKPIAVRVEGTYGVHKVVREIAPGALNVTLEFPQVRLVTVAERWAAMGLGVFFVVLILILLSIFPDVRGLPALSYRAVLALGIALIFSSVTGFLNVGLTLSWGLSIVAGGAAAAFVLIYLINPPTP